MGDINYNRLIQKSLLCLVVLLSPMSSYLFAQNPPDLAICQFEGVRISDFEIDILMDSFWENISQLNEYSLIDRGINDLILEHSNIDFKSCHSRECYKQLGELLEVNYLIDGNLKLSNSTYILELRIFDLDRGRNIRVFTYKDPNGFDHLVTQGVKEASLQLIKDSKGSGKAAKLAISSFPLEAEVYLDNEYVGMTPLLDSLELEAGLRYSLRLKKDLFEPRQTTFTLKPGANEMISLELDPTPSTLSVTGYPLGAQLSIGKQHIGTLPLQNYMIDPGSYKVKASLSGFKSRSFPVELSVSQRVQLEVNLKPKSKLAASSLSIIIPGFGQFYSGFKARGLIFLAASIGSGFMAYREYSNFLDSRDHYLDRLDLYNTANNPATFADLAKDLDQASGQLNQARQNTFGFMAAFGGVWAVNLIEVNVNKHTVNKSRAKAFLFSSILPGTGQIYKREPLRGMLFLLGSLGAGYLSFNEYTTFQRDKHEYNNNLDLYNRETNPALFDSRLTALDDSHSKMKNSESNFTNYLMALGGIWTINLIEVVF